MLNLQNLYVLAGIIAKITAAIGRHPTKRPNPKP